MKRFTIASALAVVSAGALAAVAVPLAAKDKDDQAEQAAARAALARGEILPIPRILAAATRAVPGDVVKVKLEREKWGWKYEVKVLASTGRVREVELDARTAQVRQIEED